jgi:hypothetical protein
MNSLTLKKNNFTEFISLKELTLSQVPSDKACIIVLADKTLTGNPASDILYIGRSKKPAKRIFGGYIAGYGGKTNKRINANLCEQGCLEKISISWLTSEKPKATQQELLKTFKKEHGNYPEWNIKKTEKTPPKPKIDKTVKSKPKPASKPATKAVK